MQESFSPAVHELSLQDQTRGEIRDPNEIGVIEVPKAKESFRERDGKLIITPENMPEGISVVVGARTFEKGATEWTDRVFVTEAGIDPNKTIRIQQGHTANAIEVVANQAPAFDLIKDETGKVIEDKRLTTEEGAKVDAAWTKDKDTTLMIGSADCAAICISGKDKSGKDIIAIAHSGIAGTQKDLAGNLIRQMTEKGDADPSTFQVYVSPSICDACYPILSEGASDEQIAKATNTETGLTYASESFNRFKEKYGQKFKELFDREINQNDLFYIAQNSKGEKEVHYRVDNQIFISLVCNGVNPENIGYSQVCTKNDKLPSARGTGETTGVFSTISIKQ